MHNRIAHGLADCGTLFAALLVFAGYCGAQTPAPALTTLHTFVNGASDGIVPQGVAVGSGGVIYGTTARGGASGYGTVFSLTPPAVGLSGAWTETVLYSFTGRSDGGGPLSVAIGKDGVLYGTTAAGGTGTATCAGGCGTVFSLTPPASAGGAWTKATLYRFTGGSDGWGPDGGVFITKGGLLLGATEFGGSCQFCGTVFALEQ